MKKLFCVALLLCGFFMVSNAQNIQLHYDFGHKIYDECKDRPKLTTTVEMFKPDKWGNTFFFVDMDYADGKVASAYWEIARELRFWKAPISAHIEYNGGLNYINDAYLVGPSYSYNNATFTKGFTFMALYKYLRKNESKHAFQLTGTWYMNLDGGKYTFSGFADFWKEKHKDYLGNAHNYVFITEPQFWVNLNKFKGVDENFNLSIGTEWEISHNFAVMKGWHWIPTLAMKWSF
ncbi:MAG: DUF5020 family protein [Phocaeicola sp.]|nr:DUF5020 family protein [Phocaeicola sp.]MDY5938602.1 DUF5020 family protein [Phocaeicola sp.]